MGLPGGARPAFQLPLRPQCIMGYIWKIGRHHYTAPKINTIFIEPYFNTCIYFTYMKSNLNIFTCSETDLKPASQYCHCSVSNEQENTTRLAQYLYHTVLRVKRIGITRLYDVFTQLVAQLSPFRLSHNKNVQNMSCHEKSLRSSDQTTTSFPVRFPRGLSKHLGNQAENWDFSNASQRKCNRDIKQASKIQIFQKKNNYHLSQSLG